MDNVRRFKGEGGVASMYKTTTHADNRPLTAKKLPALPWCHSFGPDLNFDQDSNLKLTRNHVVSLYTLAFGCTRLPEVLFGDKHLRSLRHLPSAPRHSSCNHCRRQSHEIPERFASSTNRTQRLTTSTAPLYHSRRLSGGRGKWYGGPGHRDQQYSHPSGRRMSITGWRRYV